MRFQKLHISENQVELFDSPRLKGLLRREDAHVFAMINEGIIHALALISKESKTPTTYVFQYMYLRKGTDKQCLFAMISQIEKLCKNKGAEYMACHLQGEPIQMAEYAELFTQQEYIFSQGGHSLIYFLEELADCRLMEIMDEAKALLQYVKPFRALNRKEKGLLVEMLKESKKYHLKSVPDPEYGLAVVVKEQIVAFLDARKLGENIILAPSVFLWKHKLSKYARAILMMYLVKKSVEEMPQDTVIYCQTYNELVYQQCLEWFGIPEKEEYVVELVKAI